MSNFHLVVQLVLQTGDWFTSLGNYQLFTGKESNITIISSTRSATIRRTAIIFQDFFGETNQIIWIVDHGAKSIPDTIQRVILPFLRLSTLEGIAHRGTLFIPMVIYISLIELIGVTDSINVFPHSIVLKNTEMTNKVTHWVSAKVQIWNGELTILSEPIKIQERRKSVGGIKWWKLECL
ncbi:hypothetical protein CPB84DRAFT_1828413 [Gymnopilus junonius]|uniref:Uncharacterized protein n=1 Tax=Gymnopilus junonius TaxID=109634 RepID=A0A9P5NF04_GYMJU|nr:hypothetical protein CPB84DRAFT_1828413 [Gymnopilus junonius]